MLSNNHTPLIAHTANNILTTYTGLYGDRAGMPISNSYRTFNPDGTTAPAVPVPRAGCAVGGTATANTILENTGVDIPKVFGPNSPEAQQLAADSDSFKDPETADYVGTGGAPPQTPPL